MPTIYDNIENRLTKGLGDTLELSYRADFCVGYFNLRGWKQVSAHIEKMAGGTVVEDDNEVHRTCRLLVGMQKMPKDLLRTYFQGENNDAESNTMSNKIANQLRKEMAQEFREQLVVGVPTNDDEKALRVLSQQLKEGKVVVKLHLDYPLHAKLYLAYGTDKRLPTVAFLGSSNLTFSGLQNQGELNIDVLEQDAAKK